jgi:formamidopyrimidine-DNA glycosylase
MAELPELETARRDLDKDLSGKKIKNVEVIGSVNQVVPGATKKALSDSLSGMKIVDVRRVGMLLVMGIGDEQSFVIEIGPTGSLQRTANSDAMDDRTQLTIGFTQGGELRLLDSGDGLRVAVVATENLGEAFPEMLPLGFDPIEEPMAWTAFGQLLVPQNRKLKGLLMDDSFVIGLGPIYSDEILHAALLRHDRIGSKLITQEIRRLYRAIVETVHNACKHRGVSIGNMVDVFGESGGYDEYIEVYGRVGERSRNGRGDVMQSRVGGIPHYHCDYQV